MEEISTVAEPYPGEKIRQKIIRRAVERSCFWERRKEEELRLEWVLEGLQELTGLPREELDRIADEVEAGYGVDGDTFFSIRQQFLTALALAVILAGAVMLF